MVSIDTAVTATFCHF